jgi:cytochrome c oxidase assembly protein subunit 15
MDLGSGKGVSSDSVMTAHTSVIAQSAPGRRAVGIWLLCVAVLIVAMLAVGGLTRLTGSGLSITQWDPIVGAVPPLSHADWEEAFSKYQQIPQYRLVNAGMTLEAFKGIFWWEWIHRFLGRLIGFAFFVPFVWFAATGAIGRKDWPRMLLLFALGGLQGFVGWWMVQSGLEVRVSVSQYRLAIHLGVAVLLLGAILWVALEYLRPRIEAKSGVAAKLAAGFAGMVFLQMMLGALVAGLHAGRHYNTWPSMNGEFLPEHSFDQGWLSFFETPALAQFNHRMVAYVVAASAWLLWSWLRTRSKASLPAMARYASSVVLAITAVQIVLGIEALLYQVPVALSALHQVVAALLFCAAIWQAFELGVARTGRTS